MPIIGHIVGYVRRYKVRTAWVCFCVYLLIRLLTWRHAAPHAFGDAEDYTYLLMAVVTCPISMLVIVGLSHLPVWPYPDSDARIIFAGWSLFFVAGCIQWFVIAPPLLDKASELSWRLIDHVRARRVRRRNGIADTR